MAALRSEIGQMQRNVMAGVDAAGYRGRHAYSAVPAMAGRIQSMAALEALAQGRENEARALLREALEADPQDAAAAVVLAHDTDRPVDPTDDEATLRIAIATWAGVAGGLLGAAPAIAIADDGAFVVSWQSLDANGQGVYARHFDASANPVGGDLAVIRRAGFGVGEYAARRDHQQPRQTCGYRGIRPHHRRAGAPRDRAQ